MFAFERDQVDVGILPCSAVKDCPVSFASLFLYEYTGLNVNVHFYFCLGILSKT